MIDTTAIEQAKLGQTPTGDGSSVRVQPASSYSGGGFGPSNTPAKIATSMGGFGGGVASSNLNSGNIAQNGFTVGSDAKFNPFTGQAIGTGSLGSVIQAPQGYQDPMTGQTNAIQNQLGNTPSTPSPYSANGSLMDTLNNYAKSNQDYTNQQTGVQSQLDAITSKDAELKANAGLGVANLTNPASESMTDHAVTGLGNAIQNMANSKIQANDATAVPLQAQLARIQAARQASSDVASKFISAQSPVSVPYGTQYINPVSGKSALGNSGQGVNVIAPGSQLYPAMQQYAQARATGQESLIPSSISGNPALNAQVTAMAQQSNPNYNYNSAAGQAAATQSNTQTAGTASVDANNSIYQKALADSATIGQQLGNVDQLGNLLLSTAQGGGINPYDSKFANQSLAAIRGQLSGSAQANFDSTMATLKSKIGTLLNAGGGAVTDNVRNQAQKVIDDSLSINALPALLKQIQAEGAIVSKNQQDVAAKAYQNLQGNKNTNNQPKSSSSLYNF
jgi:hypothetical protein